MEETWQHAAVSWYHTAAVNAQIHLRSVYIVMVTVIDANFALMLSCVVLGLCDRALGVVHCGSSTVWVVFVLLQFTLD